MKLIGMIITLLLAVGSAKADFEFYRGARQLGMGGAVVAVANDETSILTQPNGLGRLRDYFYTYFDPEITNSQEGGDATFNSGVLGVVDPQTLYDELDVQKDKPFYFKGQVFPSIAVPNFGIGLLGKYEVLAQRNSNDSYNLRYINDYALASAFNLRFWEGRIKIGFSGRLINRTEYFADLLPSGQPFQIQGQAAEGMGLGVDGGITFAAPWRYLPTIAAVVRDIGGTSFTMSDGIVGNGAPGLVPNMIPYTVDVGAAIFPILTNNIRNTLTVDYRNILTATDQTNESSIDRFHMGTEF
ncbi:MAG: hypothetical protein AAFU60_16735, partial [Bacteroidota bacterium]